MKLQQASDVEVPLGVDQHVSLNDELDNLGGAVADRVWHLCFESIH
jgi:hypothetical protein